MLSTHWTRGFLTVMAAVLLGGCLPTASFVADPTGGQQPLTVTFEDTSATLLPLRISLNEIFPLYRWEWDFGDGAGSLLQNPDHEYTVAGEYTVTLTVFNAFGSNTVVEPNLINVTTETSAPTASFTIAAVEGDGFTFDFTDTSDAGSRPILEWVWDFGDGNGSDERNPTHTYAEEGDYEITLQVRTVVGANAASEELTVPTVLPTADFMFERGDDGELEVKFKDASDPGSASEIDRANYVWDFGDESSITNAINPSHTYAEAGEYQVTLTVTTPAGTDSVTKTVSVPAPEAE